MYLHFCDELCIESIVILSKPNAGKCLVNRQHISGYKSTSESLKYSLAVADVEHIFAD